MGNFYNLNSLFKLSNKIFYIRKNEEVININWVYFYQRTNNFWVFKIGCYGVDSNGLRWVSDWLLGVTCTSVCTRKWAKNAFFDCQTQTISGVFGWQSPNALHPNPGMFFKKFGKSNMNNGWDFANVHYKLV